MEKDLINRNTEIWKIKTYINCLNLHRGEDGTLVSLFVPQSINLQDVHKKLNDEEEKASKLARDTQRVHLLDALRMAQRLFNHYDTTPCNGLAFFCGTCFNDEEGERRIRHRLLPFVPIEEYIYTCDNKFHTEPLAALLPKEESLRYGFIVVDSEDSLYGTLQGTTKTILKEFHYRIPILRGLFAHQKDRWSSFLEKVADTARGVFISGGAVTVDGLMLAKSHRLPAEVSLDAALDTRLRERVLRTVEYQASDTKKGLSCAIKFAADLLEDVRYVQEDQIIDRLFKEIGNSTNKYCFGLEDTIRYLHAGVIDTLVCWEDLNIIRMVVSNPETVITTTLFLTPEQRRDPSLFKAECEGEVSLEILESQPLPLWLAENYIRLGFNLEMVSGKSELGEQFVKTLSGIGATLCVIRHDLGDITSTSNPSDYEV